MKRSIISTRKRYVTIFSVVLFSILVAQQLCLVYAGPLQVQRRPTKGLLIDVKLLGQTDIPSLSDLARAGFTLVGTQVKPDFGPADWSKVAAWIESAHRAGLAAFISVGVPLVKDLSMAAAWTGKAASIGADAVDLVELIVTFNPNQTAMQSVIEAGLAVKPNLQFIITEYNPQYVQAAYSFTSKYPSVRVAGDAYDDKARIDRNILLGLNYRKRAYTWLAFSGVSRPFDCYLHLDDWIAYVKQKDTDVLFYWINGGPWQVKWPKVQSF